MRQALFSERKFVGEWLHVGADLPIPTTSGNTCLANCAAMIELLQLPTCSYPSGPARQHAISSTEVIPTVATEIVPVKGQGEETGLPPNTPFTNIPNGKHGVIFDLETMLDQ